MQQNQAHKFCVAPMMDWTDRHCRYFHRQLSKRARLYTEMVTSAAIAHGDRQRLLAFDPSEHPVALQLGGSDPDELARAAETGAAFGYVEINLNCGCPSDRVQSGRFGACLMAEAALVGQCVSAMQSAVGGGVPVTVKCRIGIDDQDSEADLSRFVETVASAGCGIFIVHARKAWLKGLSPKENRDVPPLDYERVYRLKAAFPELTVVINGGIATLDEALVHLERGGRRDARAGGLQIARDTRRCGPALVRRRYAAAGRGRRSGADARLRRLRAGARHEAFLHNASHDGPHKRQARRARLPAGC